VRIDYQFIEKHVPRGARVLDLGCGDGALLEELGQKRDVEGIGIEIDEQSVQQCISRGIPVYHGDMLESCSMFDDKSFDFVILSQTLQQSLDPVRVIEEMLRIGHKCIISFPNFGHWPVRLKLLFTGRMPVTENFPYSWYESPNVNLLTINDFVSFCKERNLKIVDRVFFTTGFYRPPSFAANLLAASAVFVLED